MSNSLKQRIKNYLDKYGDWLVKEKICELAKSAGYSSENAGRRLRELAEDDLIEVEYRKGQKGQELSFYRTKTPKKRIAYKIQLPEGIKEIIKYE